MRAESKLAIVLLVVAWAVVFGAAAQEPAATDAVLQERLERIEDALSNQGLLQMLQQLENLELELSRLRGEVEVQNHTLEQLKKRQRDMYADMDRRLQRFETPSASDTLPGADAPPLQTLAPLSSAEIAGGEPGTQASLTLELVKQAPTSAAGEAEHGVPLAAVAEQLPAPDQDLPPSVVTAQPPSSVATTGAALETAGTETAGAETAALAAPGPELPEAARPQAGAAPPDAPAPGQQDPQLIRQEYRQAFNLLKQARFNEAVLGLRGFVTRYPDSEDAANAQFWLAEAYYVNSLFEQALAEYTALARRYPDSPKLSQAELKAAFCRQELGQVEAAIQQLKDLIAQHPGTTAASLAQDRLTAIVAETVPE